MIPLIALLTFASTTVLALYVMRPKGDYVRQRILEGATPNQIAQERGLQDGPIRRLVLPGAMRFSGFLAKALPQNLVKGIDHLLLVAGQPMSVAGFLSLWFCIIGMGAVIVVAVIRVNPDIAATRFIVLAVMIMTLAVLVPYGILRRRARRRSRAIQRALPDALDLLVTSIEAGLGIDSAFALVSERASPAIAAPFNEYLRQVGLGRPRRDALEEVAARTGAEDFIQLAGTVAQASEVGTSMGDVIRIQARELRALRKARAQEAAQKAPVWMVIPLVFCFLPAMFAVIVVPSILHLLDFVEGLGG
ncbi:MAG TPA: type II secretion system F family protein [Dehalococcoidia bacterium]|nr:type II secretion system F family protein [Dehalococcoidia bacterium]